MAHPAYIREKARELRVERRLSIVEIAERLALPKTTVFYWVRDIPLQRPPRANPGQRKGNRSMRRKYRELTRATPCAASSNTTLTRTSISYAVSGARR
jgi:hypothetical protein